jgi:hypothetical protein
LYHILIIIVNMGGLAPGSPSLRVSQERNLTPSVPPLVPPPPPAAVGAIGHSTRGASGSGYLHHPHVCQEMRINPMMAATALGKVATMLEMTAMTLG